MSQPMAASARPAWRWVALSGVLLGAIYTLSPLALLCAVALVPLVRWAGRDLSARERRWFYGVITLALLARLAAVAVLFVSADSSTPFATFFGDEELFKRRGIWLRNIGLGVPVAGADFIYAFDETGDSSYLYLLAYVQALVGAAPYGVHLLNAWLYLAAALVLYRLARRGYGGMTAMIGLGLLLFLPSLFTWSISALKEPLYIMVAALQLICGVAIVRAPKVWLRMAAVAGVVAGALALESLRNGGVVLASVGTTVGLLIGFVITRPRLLLASVLIAPIAAAVVFARPAVQERLLAGIHRAAVYHWGHLATPGNTFELIDPRFYEHRSSIVSMTPPEAGEFVARAVASYVTVPLPWQIQSRTALAYVPELMVWYVVVLLVPVGIVAGLRRDALLTCLVLSHGLIAVMMVALTGGNVGTLIRHRGLALLYLVWLAALGGVDTVRRLTSRDARLA